MELHDEDIRERVNLKRKSYDAYFIRISAREESVGS